MDCSIDGCVRAAYRAGLCSRHYDEHRRENAPPCKIAGCAQHAERVGMCNAHYRQQLRTEAPACTVAGCGRGQQTNGLCNTHYMRTRRHGSLDADKRAHDRGARRKHPLNESWRWHSRNRTLAQAWRDDFWAMVSVVGERASPAHRLVRPDVAQPLGPNNWQWVESIKCEDRNAYMREWSRRNTRRVKGHDLKRRFGIRIEDFERMLEEQGGLCAICAQEETALRPGGMTARDLAVDHCHKTGKVRGLVCSSCNLLIGKYEANPDLLESLVAYMHRHSTE